VGRGLHQKLRDPGGSNIILPAMHDWATEITILGRCRAHSEWQDVRTDEVESLVELTNQVLNFVYVVPEQFEKAKEAGKKPRKSNEAGSRGTQDR